MSVKVSAKYEIVLPEAVRDALKIEPGAEVDVIAKGGVAYIVPIKFLQTLASTLEGKLSVTDVERAREKTTRNV